MSQEIDFERYWLDKFSNCLEEGVGEDIRDRVMQGNDRLSQGSDRQQVIDWSSRAMELLDELVDPIIARDVMTGCACQYPLSELLVLRIAYEETGDVSLVQRKLQEKFEDFLRDTLKLEEDMIRDIVNKGWGLAGEYQGDKIIATKIPKSGYLVQYMQESDPEKKRQLYCHCPRVRDALKIGGSISTTYCYCGAGFYKGIWEEILQSPVEVELLESVLGGDEVCRVVIHLP